MREKSFRVNNILDFKYVFSLRLSVSARDIAFKSKNDGSLVCELIKMDWSRDHVTLI